MLPAEGCLTHAAEYPAGRIWIRGRPAGHVI